MYSLADKDKKRGGEVRRSFISVLSQKFMPRIARMIHDDPIAYSEFWELPISRLYAIAGLEEAS